MVRWLDKANEYQGEKNGEKERRGREDEGVRRQVEKQIGGLLRKQWCGS